MLGENVLKTDDTITHLDDLLILSVLIMAIRVVEFSNGGYKIREIFA